MKKLTIAIALLLAAPVFASEGYDVTPAPAVAVDDVARYVIEQFTILRPVAGKTADQPQRTAQIFLRFVGLKADGTCAVDSRGECQRKDVSIGDEARAIQIMNALNNADLTTNTLVKRVFALPEVSSALGTGAVSGDSALPTPTPTPAGP